MTWRAISVRPSKEGLYIDALTRSITAQTVTFNANLKQVANALITFSFNDAGYIDVTSKVTNLNIMWQGGH